MRKVCFVSPKFYLNTVGGAEVQLYLMASELASLGAYQVFYVTPNIEQTRKYGALELVKIRTNNGDPSGMRKDCSFEEFAETLDSLSPDLVVQVGRKQFTHHTARYCVVRQIPFVFRVTSDIECRRFRQLPRFFGEYPLRRALNVKRLAREFNMDTRTFWAIRQAAAIIAQTATQKEMLDQLFRKEGKRIALLQNLHRVPPDEDIVKDERPMVLWLASIKSVKRPRLYLKIARSLRESGCRVVMAGRMNEEEFRADIREAVESGYLEYIEDVGFDASNDLIARARVFVLTSMREGLPNTLIQAWMRRTPVVSLGVDPDSMISNNELGVYVDNVDAAVEAIKFLVGNTQEYERLGRRVRMYAEERFGAKAQARKLKAVLDEAFHACG